MDNNYNNNTNKQEGYNTYGNSQNSDFGNNNQFNQQYGTQDYSSQEHQNNNILNKDNYDDQYSNSFYNQEQYNQQYNNTYNQSDINNDNTYGQSQYNNNMYSQNNYNTQYDNGQQYNSQMNYQYNNSVTSNSPGYGYSIGSMVCGICGLISCWCYGFPGVILGIVALILYFKSKKMDGGVSNAMAKAGMVCGIISLILGVIYVAYVIFAFVVLGITMSDPSFYSDFYSTAFLK